MVVSTTKQRLPLGMRKTLPRKPGFPSRIQILVGLAGSFDELAEMSDISRRALSDWARALREPQPAQYVKLAEGCGVDPHGLRTGEGVEPKRLHEYISPSKSSAVSASEEGKARDLLGEVDVVPLGPSSILTLSHPWAMKEGLGEPLCLLCADRTASPRIGLGDPILAVRVPSLHEAWIHDPDGVWVVEREGKYFLRTIVLAETELVLRTIGGNPQEERVSPTDVVVRGRAVWVGRRL